MPLLIINSTPIEEKHICWYTKKDPLNTRNIVLVEIVNAKYNHPQAPDSLYIWVIEEKFHQSVNRSNYTAGALIVLEANQNAISHMKDLEEEK